jgi:HK97 family phage prohead protease
MPFAGYTNFDDCVRKNKNKKDPEAYCATIMREVEGKSFKFFTDNLGWEQIETKAGTKHFVTGYISTKDIDLDNDIVTEDCLKDMLNQLREKNIKLDVDHEAYRDSPNIIPVGRIVEAKLDTKGIWVKAELNEASPKFNSVWKSIKNKFIDAFSIAFKPVKDVKKSMDNAVIRLLHQVELLNVALTGNPVNPECGIGAVFTKSLNDMKAEPTPEEREELRKQKKKEEEEEEEEKCGTIKKKSTEEIKMVGDQPEEKPQEEPKTEETPQEEPAPAPAEPAPAEEPQPEAPAEDAPAEEPAAETETKSEIKKLREELKSIKKQLKEPVMKGTAEETPKIIKKSKVTGALDLIR